MITKVTYTDKYRKIIADADDTFIIMDMDNNQRGQRKNQQREGKIDNCIVVTHSLAINSTMTISIDTLSDVAFMNRSDITYLIQVIVSPWGMKELKT